MQYLNDDIDELARRAAENYPLDISGANWDKVKSSLQEPIVSKKGKTNWLWLLPLAIFWISNTFIAYRQGYGDGKSFFEKQNSSTHNNSINNNSISNNNSNSISNSTRSIILRKQDPVNQPNLVDQRPVLIPESNQMIFKKSARQRISNSIAFNKTKTKTAGNSPNNIIADGGENGSGQDYRNLNEPLPIARTYIPISPSHLYLITRPSIVPVNKKEESTLQHKSKSKSSKILYGSVIVGSDMNTVKMQALSKPGITTGLKIGFQLNKWALETGLLYDKKNYSSDGKYFNYKIYPNTKINSVSGTCNMFEWPIDIHYVFNTVSKHTLYVSAGLSSYLMKKEDYTYDYDWYGQSYYSNKTYKNSSKNFFSVINISAGYQVKVGRTSSLRFEPYGKLPLKGVGIGSLPLTSFGVNLIVSKNFLQR